MSNEIILWCWVQGDKLQRMFPVGIKHSDSIGHLKEAIRAKKPSFERIAADSLQLFKFQLPLESLQEDYAQSIKLEDDQELTPWRCISYYWEEPVEAVLSVILPRPAGTTITPSSSHNSNLSSHKRRRVEEDEIGDALGVAYPRPALAMIDQITRIHNAIKSIPDTMDFSNPATLTMLPFPSPLDIPSQQFEWQKLNNLSIFSYMGRSKFSELYDHMQSPNFLEGFEKIYLYGTSGSGKSHILAALVCRLIREGKRVVYIPDCTRLLDGFISAIRSALHFAFYDSEPDLMTIESADQEGLFTFWAGQKDTYLVVDQLNTLEPGGSNIQLDKVKQDVVIFLRQMRVNHKYIFSSSANEQSNREVVRKQSGIKVISMNGGMNQDETDHWFIHHTGKLPPLSSEDRKLVEYLTGRIPLLLRALFGYKKFDYNCFMAHSDLCKVNDDVLDFFKNKNENPADMEIYYAIMDACLQSRKTEYNFRQLCDLRYFYIDPDYSGHFTCGVAFETMMSLFRQYRLSMFCGEEWYSAVRRSSENPVVQGFLAEHICLSQIVSCGLLVVSRDLGRMLSSTFTAKPDWGIQLSSDHKVRLYIPTAYNFRAVDAAILYRNAKRVHIYLIQFTLSMRHKLSDEDFYQTMWWEWVQPLTEKGYSVKSTFVWIDKKQPENCVKSELVKKLRSETKTVRPEYTSIHVGIEQVDQRLARVLAI